MKSDRKANLEISMELLPDTDGTRCYTIGCVDCPCRCALSFLTQDKLSLASAGVLGSALYLLCRKLAPEVVVKGRLDGQKTVTFDAIEGYQEVVER